MCSNFVKVCDFNKSFGLPHNDEPQTEVLNDNVHLSQLRLNLCKEEIDELNEAFTTKNFTEVIDALTDELYVLYGAGSSFGVNLDALFRNKIKDYYGVKCEDDYSNFLILKSCVKSEKGLLVGLPDTIQKDIFKDKLSYHIEHHLNKINAEVLKLENYINNKEYTASIDTIVKLLFYIYRMGLYLGIDLDMSFDIVHSSNMSKLCKTEKEAIDTVEWYKQNDNRYDTPDYRKSYDGTYWVVFNSSTGKILKNINYTAADFNKML